MSQSIGPTTTTRQNDEHVVVIGFHQFQRHLIAVVPEHIVIVPVHPLRVSQSRLNQAVPDGFSTGTHSQQSQNHHHQFLHLISLTTVSKILTGKPLAGFPHRK